MAFIKGQVLISEPFMAAGSFHESVILLCDVHPKGAVGFIVNKTIGMNINDLIDSFPSFESEVLYGGPVQPDTIHYIHKYGDLLPEAQLVKKDIYWGGDFERLKGLVLSGQIESSKIKFLIGYSGWDNGQLEGELKESTWVLSDVDLSFIFDTDERGIWKKVMKASGDNYSVLSEVPSSFNPN